jgi:hypothetical protein
MNHEDFIAYLLLLKFKDFSPEKTTCYKVLGGQHTIIVTKNKSTITIIDQRFKATSGRTIKDRGYKEKLYDNLSYEQAVYKLGELHGYEISSTD